MGLVSRVCNRVSNVGKGRGNSVANLEAVPHRTRRPKSSAKRRVRNQTRDLGGTGARVARGLSPLQPVVPPALHYDLALKALVKLMGVPDVLMRIVTYVPLTLEHVFTSSQPPLLLVQLFNTINAYKPPRLSD